MDYLVEEAGTIYTWRRELVDYYAFLKCRLKSVRFDIESYQLEAHFSIQFTLVCL